jgi:hypothetical protein
MIPKRRHFKQPLTLKDRLIAWAGTLRQQAEKMAPGPARDALLQKASRADTTAHLDDWANSRGLLPPK